MFIAVVGTLAAALPMGAADLAQAVPVGDDCAAIPLPGGLFLGPPELAVAHVLRLRRALAGRPGWVFNLGHGITPAARIETVAALLQAVAAPLDAVAAAP